MLKLAEWHIYGNGEQGRFVTRKPENNQTIYYLGGQSQDFAEKKFSRILVFKEYEIKDHLGNVRVAITDYKLPTNPDPTIQPCGVMPFAVDERAVNDYYPYGMLVKERSWSSSDYRYRYNGQEKSLEIDANGNHNTAEFWEYDGRSGRRWNLDPVVKPWQSGYSTFASNPIYYNDISGDDESAFMGDGEGTPSIGDGEGAGVPTFMGGTTTTVGNQNMDGGSAPIKDSDLSSTSSTGDWGQNARVEIDPNSITSNGKVKDGITNLAKNLNIPEGRNVQNKTVDAITNGVMSAVPFHDAVKNIHDGSETGDNSLVAMGIIGSGLDVASFGRGGAIVRGGAKLGERLLGRPAAKLTQEALEHIVIRHWFTSGIENVSKFSQGTTARKLKEMIEITTSYGTYQANTRNRPGQIVQYIFDKTIGTNGAGVPTRTLKVVIDEKGVVKTAYPF